MTAKTTNRLTREKRAELRKACANFLRTNGLKPTTVTGAKAVHTFWLGALTALNAQDDPFVTLCCLSGRHADLCDFSD